MKFKIHMVFEDDYADVKIIEGQSLEECQAQAMALVAQRRPDDYWSEEVHG